MKEEILNTSICLQNSRNKLPKNFNYSVFCKLNKCKSCSKFFFKTNFLFVAGTLEGPILLFTEMPNQIKHVCIMCSHKTKITSIVDFPNFDFFASSSSDGTICLWSKVDCTCIKEFNNVVQEGEIKLVLNENDPDTIWAWNIGFYSVLIDLSDGKVLKRFPIYGLTSFSCLLPNLCSLIDKQIIICTQINCIFSFKDMKKIKGKLINIHDKFYISKYGIIKVVNNAWSLISPYRLEEISNTSINEMNDNDAISCVEWSNTSTVCFGTYSGDFHIYLLNSPNNSSFDFIKIYSIKSSKNCFISFFSFFDNKIIFSSNKSSIECITTNGTHLMTKIKNKNKINYHIYGENNYIHVLIGNGKTLISENLSDHKKIVFETMSDITAISTRKTYEMKYQIITGCENGEISFYTENKSKPYMTIIGLTCPIIGFAHLPEKLNGRQLFIAIAKNGSLALIIQNDIYTYFANDEFPILQVFYQKELQNITIKRMDNVYVTYEFYQSNPIFLSLCLPSGSELIWESTEFCFEKNEFFSTNLVKYCTHQIIFNIINLSKYNNKNIHFENQVIERLYNLKRNLNEINSGQKEYSSFYENKQKTPNKDLGVLDNKNNLYDKEFLSFSLLGKNNKPVFFYKKFSINYHQAIIASHDVSVINYLSKVILTGEINEENHSELLFGICKYLSSTEPKLVNSAYLECENLLGKINETTAKTIIQKINLSTTKSSDLFVLSIIFIKFSYLLPKTIHQKLFSFLTCFKNCQNDLANLSLLIILQGFPIWSNVVGSDVIIFFELINFLKSGREMLSSQSVFNFLALSEYNSYFSAVNNIIANTNSIDEIRQILHFSTKIAASSPEFNSGYFTIKMLNLIEGKKSIINLVAEEIEAQSKLFPYITKSGKYIVVGINNGNINVYIDYKLLYTIQIFNSAIAMVSIGPNFRYCSAISIEENKAKTFELFSGHKIIEQIDLNPNKKLYEITWNNSEHCTYTPVCF